MDLSTYASTTYTHNALGQQTSVTDANGVLTAEYAYDAFGNLQVESGASDTNYLYTGQQYDDVTGLYWLKPTEAVTGRNRICFLLHRISYL